MRIKDVLGDGKLTGPPKKLSDPDEIAIRFFGEDNPKLTQIQGRFNNTTGISTSISQLSEETRPSTSGKRKQKETRDSPEGEEESLDNLHRDELRLQKRKLELSILQLEREIQMFITKAVAPRQYTFNLHKDISSLNFKSSSGAFPYIFTGGGGGGWKE